MKSIIQYIFIAINHNHPEVSLFSDYMRKPKEAITFLFWYLLKGQLGDP